MRDAHIRQYTMPCMKIMKRLFKRSEWTNERTRRNFFVRNLSFSRAFLLKINLIKSTELTFSVASSFNDRLCKEEERESFFYIFNACVCIMNEKLNHIKFSAMKWIFLCPSKYLQMVVWVSITKSLRDLIYVFILYACFTQWILYSAGIWCEENCCYT